MIISIKDKDTEKVYHQYFSSKFSPSVQKIALRKFELLVGAENLNDLRVPPANHLEKLKGSRQGQYSIRINDQYRICFSYQPPNRFFNVEIVDYH